MNKTLFGLAFISYNWDINKKDIIDSYIPLICSIISTNKYNTVERDKIQNDLIEFYGIKIPSGAIEGILKKMVRENILSRDLGSYKVNHAINLEFIKTEKKEELNKNFQSVIMDLQNFAITNFTIEFTIQELEDAIIDFFKDHDLTLLFGNGNGTTILPIVKESKKAKYIVAKYIMSLHSTDTPRFEVIQKLAKGYAIASLITYESIQQYSGKLSEVEFYLDAPIIFSLLGLNGGSNNKLITELISSLQAQGGKLRVFEVNYNEVVSTLDDAIKRLKRNDFDISKSSRVLKTSIRENISTQQLQIILNQIPEILKTNDILRVNSPSLTEKENRYQIDEKKLLTQIEDRYKNGGELSWYQKAQIERDVESLSNIFKIRKNTQATSLKSCKAIFLTNNETIATTVKNFEKSEWAFKFDIPVCVTDIFLSTIMWTNYPTKGEKLNIKQLMSECYSIIELDNKLLNKYYEDITKMHNQNTITDEQFFLLSTTNTAYSLLEQKTLNDFEQYTDKTPVEILEDIQVKYENEIQAKSAQLNNIDLRLKRFSNKIAKSLFVIIGILLYLTTIFFKELLAREFTPYVKYSIWFISVVLGGFGILRWLELIPPKAKIENRMQTIIYTKLKKLIGNE